RRHFETPDLRIAKIVRRRLLRTIQQFFAVYDLQDAALVGAITEIDPIALWPGRDATVQLGRNRAGRARFLPRQAEVADLDRFCRVAEVIDLGHPAYAPTLRARNEERDAGVAFPPVFVGVLE